jgi:mRNA export factor
MVCAAKLTISALSYDWSKGHSGAAAPGQTNTSKIMLHPVKQEEVQKKKK